MSAPSTTEVIDLTSDDMEETASRADEAWQQRRRSPQPQPPTRNGTPVPLPGHRHSTFGRATRGPRFQAEIIDLSDDSPNTISLPQVEIRQPPAQSPEIQFLSARTLPAPRREATPLVRIGLDDDDEIMITGERVIPGGFRQNPFEIIPRNQSTMSRIVQRILSNNGSVEHRVHAPRPTRTGRQTHTTVRDIQRFVAPNLDFAMIGFDLGLDRDETASPPVIPPPPAPAGYVRSPEENGEYVCENCGDELCTGKTDVERQIWVGKCGHLYCHECTINRHVTKSKKAKQILRTRPFKVCVAEGCEKKLTSKTAMIQLFL